MIGDRRGPNSLEGSVIGVSKDLPSGAALTQLHCPEGAPTTTTKSLARVNCVGPLLRPALRLFRYLRCRSLP